MTARKVEMAEGYDYVDDPGSIAERVNYLERIMIAGAYVRGGTCYVLSEKWGIRADMVSRYAAEASRRIALVQTPEERRRLLVTEAEMLSERAAATEDLGAANQILRTRAELEGLTGKGATRAGGNEEDLIRDTVRASLLNPRVRSSLLMTELKKYETALITEGRTNGEPTQTEAKTDDDT